MQGVKFVGTDEELFWSHVEKSGEDECWPWTGARNDKGYGLLSTRRATHIALQIEGNPRPPKACALHSCDNPPCCNPAHLRWGTAAENVADMIQRRRHHASRRDHCIKGHPFSGANLIERPNGQRTCRICQRRHDSEYKARRRAAIDAAPNLEPRHD